MHQVEVAAHICELHREIMLLDAKEVDIFVCQWAIGERIAHDAIERALR